MANEIRLDKKMFEALSSDTRRKILVGLGPHPLTVTDLSKLMGIQKSAVHEHLKILADVGLVYKKESNNEFVYYDLTEKGRALVNQDSSPGYKIYIMLTASLVSLAGGVFEICMFAAGVLGIPLPALIGAPGTGTPIPTTPPMATPYPTALPVPTVTPALNPPLSVDTGLIAGVVLLAAGLILLYFTLRSMKASRLKRLFTPFTRE